MFDQLRSILKELIAEFEQKKVLFVSDPTLYHAIRFGMYAARGSVRYSSGNTTYNSAICYDYGILLQIVGRFIAPFASTKKLYDFVVKNHLWHEEYESFEASQDIMPSVMTKIGGGFLCRNFALNEHRIGISVLSFEMAFNELVNFFQKDNVEYNICIHLRGCKGDIDTVVISDEVSIVKASFEVAKLFSLSYYVDQVQGVVMFEGDYLLKVKFNVSKTDYSIGNLSRHSTYEYKTIQKWLTLPVFATIGYLNIGKKIRLSTDWALSVGNIIGPFGTEENIPHGQVSEITEQTIIELKKAG